MKELENGLKIKLRVMPKSNKLKRHSFSKLKEWENKIGIEKLAEDLEVPVKTLRKFLYGSHTERIRKQNQINNLINKDNGNW